MSTDLPKICVMASFPPRKESMLKVVEIISPQCDTLCIWLNEYTEIPTELKSYKNLDIRIAPKDKNIKDAGKFAFLDKYYNCYYMTIDDDILYPANYVKMLTRNIDRYGRKCIVSYHGHVMYNKNLKKQYKYISFYGKLSQDHLVNIRTGTGVTGLVPSQIQLPILTIDELLKIDTDVSLGAWALNNHVSMICCAHRKKWLINIQIGSINYSKIQKLTGTAYLNNKRREQRKKIKVKRKICDPVLEAKILSKCLSLLN